MTSNINPKSCTYGCGLQIYWNVATSEYWEVFTQKRHSCPNRSKSVTQTTTTTAKPIYYNKKPFAGPKPKMSNSLELLTGPISEIQWKYEILSDIVSEYNGKVHGSQRGQDPRTGQLIDLLVYYEVSLGNREEVKQKFNNHFVYTKSYT